MAGKKDYRSCMADAMRGKRMSKEERQREFCVQAKLCSQKVSSREEAERICALPKAPKATKGPASTPRTHIQAMPTQGSRATTLKPAPIDRAHCEMTAFGEAARMYKDLYALVYPERDECGHCDTLRARILDVDIPHPIVDIPGDICPELADSFGVSVYPSIVRLKRGKVKAVHTGSPDAIIKKMMEGK